jgi:uncharacterized protein YbjT (DUF2867 family)
VTGDTSQSHRADCPYGMTDNAANTLIGRPPTGEITEYAGPEVLSLDDLARTWLTARASKRPIWRLRIPGGMARAIRSGAQATEATPTGTHTWRDYLATKY